MEKVTGFGGAFFRAKDPEALGLWYEKHLGINSMSSTTLWWQEKGPTVFAPFNHDTDYFGRPEQMFMFNFRVSDLDAMITQLNEQGITTEEVVVEEGTGRFTWIFDPEGNKIELWEPDAHSMQESKGSNK